MHAGAREDRKHLAPRGRGCLWEQWVTTLLGLSSLLRRMQLSPDPPFFMPNILLLTDNEDAQLFPGLNGEWPSPVPPVLPLIFGGIFSPNLSREIIAQYMAKTLGGWMGT